MQRLLRFQENTFLLLCMPESKHGAVNLSDTKNVPFLSVRQSRSQIFAFLETLMTDYHFLFHSHSPSREWNDLIITNVSWCLHAPSWGRESWESQEGCSGTQTAGFSQPSWLLWWDYLTTRVVFGWPSQNFMSSFFNVKEDVYILALKYLFSLAQRGCVMLTQWLKPQCWSPLSPPLQCLMLKLQLGRVLMSGASRAICPCDRDTNDDPDRNDTGSC